MKPGIDALQSLPLLATCTPAMLTRLNAVSDLARLGANEVLFRQGDHLNELNILTAGYAVTTQSQPDGDDAVVNVVEPVTPIGLPMALLGGASPIGSRTVTSARVIVIEAAELTAMMRKFPPLALSFLNQALGSLQDQTLENARLKLRTTAQRLADYLLSLIKGRTSVRPALCCPSKSALLPRRSVASQRICHAYSASSDQLASRRATRLSSCGRFPPCETMLKGDPPIQSSLDRGES